MRRFCSEVSFDVRKRMMRLAIGCGVICYACSRFGSLIQQVRIPWHYVSYMPSFGHRFGHDLGPIRAFLLILIHKPHQTDTIASQNVQPQRKLFHALVRTEDPLDAVGQNQTAHRIRATQCPDNAPSVLRDDEYAFVQILLQRRQLVKLVVSAQSGGVALHSNRAWLYVEVPGRRADELKS